MALNILEIQDTIFAHLVDNVVHRVEDIGIPDEDTVLRDSSGKIIPYIAVQIGDPQVQYSGRGFVGTRFDDYELPVYIQSIGGTPRGCRVMASHVLDALLGMKFEWTGQVRKRPGGLMWPLTVSNGATEAYMFPTSFAVTIQMTEV